MNIEGAVAVVTGGASGLGRGTVEALAARGAKVAILDLPTSSGESVAAELGDDVIFVPVDVRSEDDVAQAVAHVADAFGKISINVNTAGIATASRVVKRDGTPHDLDLFRRTIDVNLIGAFNVLRQCAAVMARNEPTDDGERGLVITVASVAAFDGQIGQAAYSASKGGIVGMTLPLARDLATVGVRVMTIAPGIMDTPMLGSMDEELREQLAQVHVLPKRLGTPEDFAKLVVHCAENTLLNGEVIRLDAGARLPPR